MGIETKVDSNYQIFKLVQDELNYTYVAEGAATQETAPDLHGPRFNTKKMKYFTDHLSESHLKYLAENNSTPRNYACSFISFSYEPSYESAFMGGEIWHTERLNDDEKRQFEQSMVESHEKYSPNEKPRY